MKRPELESGSYPIVPIPQDPFIPRRRLQRIVNKLAGGEFVRYLLVGVFNTFFGYCTFAICFTLLNKVVPVRFLYLTAPLGSVISTPLNISVAYFGYKIFVFRTKGNHLKEWLKCFAVYGTGMIPGLLALSALTRFLQSVIHTHAVPLHAFLASAESHLSGHPLILLKHVAVGSAMAGYIAGAITTGVTTLFSFVGHKKVTFKAKPAPSV